MDESPSRVVLRWTIVSAIALAAIVAILFVILFAGKAYSRYQKRQDANNAVKVTHILIQKANQQAQINRAQIAATKAEAEKRYQESIGIRRAQDEISRTLTPLYVQHEAIQAQRAQVNGENHTEVYIPAGQNGVPIVKPVPGEQTVGK